MLVISIPDKISLTDELTADRIVSGKVLVKVTWPHSAVRVFVKAIVF